jgi:hypothetical protein
MSEPANLALVRPQLSPEQYSLLEQTVGKIFDIGISDPAQALVIVQQDLEGLDLRDASTRVTQVVLESTGRYFQAFNKMTREANFGEARDLLQQAVEGFGSAGFDSLRDVSIGIGAYAAAVFEVQNLNLTRADELLKQAKVYLQQAGRFGAKFQPLLDKFEPDHLFIGAFPYLMRLDFDTAAPLIEKASQSAERVAATYYQDGDSDYFLFRGLAHIYRAHYRLVKSFSDFNQFSYLALTSQKDLETDAIKAQKFLAQVEPANEVVNNLRHLSVTILNLQGSLVGLAGLMQKVFLSTFKSSAPALQDSKNKAQAALDAATKAGPTAVPLVRLCSQTLNQISNLERYAKPTKKDLGVLSGLVACALFLPLFLLVSWVNSAFQVGVGGTTVTSTCMILALIGGFGYGALRFRTWITGAAPSSNTPNTASKSATPDDGE